jgi:hypothetical protein
LGCNCGKNKAIGKTADAIAEDMRRQEFEKRVAEETSRAASGEHGRPR